MTQNANMENNINSFSLKDVGNIIKLREHIDPQHRITNHIRSHLAVTDMIPITYSLTLSNVNSGSWAISYDPMPAIERFSKVCNSYELESYSGVRLWLTEDCVAVDNITNNYEQNAIETGFDKLSGASHIIQSANALRSRLQSTGESGNNLLQMGQDFANNTVGTVSDYLTEFISDGDLRNQVNGVITTLGKTAASMIFEGKKISLPKIWRSTSYSPALHLTIKLVSPYGDPKAIKHYIIEPLLYVLILSLPTTNDGLSYGLPTPIWVNGYGSTSLNLGFIDSLQIRRGGKETSYNIYKQPLTLDISITIRPLVDGIATTNGIKDFVNFGDSDTEASEDPTGSRPCITTLGNIINSLRPAPNNIVLEKGQNTGSYKGFEQFTSMNQTPQQTIPIPSQVNSSLDNLL